MIDVGWLPDLQDTTVRPGPWIGRLTFKVFADGWSDGSWFAPESVPVTIDVRPDVVEVRSGAGVSGAVPRDQLRVWFAHGTADLEAGDVAWRSRPMGVALGLSGWGTSPVPTDIAAQLAKTL